MCKTKNKKTLKKYTTTRCIVHITMYNKHKHNHHYSHDTSSSLELSQSPSQNWYPQLARTGMAVFQLPFPTFRANLSGVLCTETVEATMPMAVESCDVTISLWLYGSKQTLGQNTYDHAAVAVISLAHSAVTYWFCFAIHKHLRHLKNMKWLLRDGIYTCIYCVKIFSRWNIPKRRSEAKIGQNQCSGAL